MKTIFSLLIGVLLIAGCNQSTSADDPANSADPHAGQTEWTCGTYNGHTLYTGPKGGCYYYASSGNKTYVDRSYCNCSANLNQPKED
ncbi:MAG: hypothetical protein UZ07_CHB004001105 [Chlorobi bacterium OLB7]|nr:MAG: hypothetical protein UZ07_CHB004001105 [Chlorobi bacterium OLB7]